LNKQPRKGGRTQDVCRDVHTSTILTYSPVAVGLVDPKGSTWNIIVFWILLPSFFSYQHETRKKQSKKRKKDLLCTPKINTVYTLHTINIGDVLV
jgi:hypothetical protein